MRRLSRVRDVVMVTLSEDVRYDPDGVPGGRPVPRTGGAWLCGQAARAPQTLIWARAVSVGRPGPACGKPGQALVLRARCRCRSMVILDRARAARARPRFAAIRPAGGLAVAAPEAVVAMR